MSVVRAIIDDGVLVVTFVKNELRDAREVELIGRELLAIRRHAVNKFILLNLDGVDFLSSSMVGQLFLLGKHCQADGIELRMCCVNEMLREVFDVVQLVRFLPVDEDEYTARSSFGNSSADGKKTIEMSNLRNRADQGDPNAKYELGCCYENGWSVEADLFEAHVWYRRAADDGQADAQYKLGVAYAYAIQADQDYVEAVKWFRKAASQGHPDAQYAMGMTCCYGLIAEQDATLAQMWYQRAAAQGHAGAREELDRMESNST